MGRAQVGGDVVVLIRRRRRRRLRRVDVLRLEGVWQRERWAGDGFSGASN